MANKDQLLPVQRCNNQKMEEDVSEFLGTEDRLERFAIEYGKLSVLWNKDHKKFKHKPARMAALRSLERALGCGEGGPPGRRAADAVQQFRHRLQQEVLGAFAEASLRGGAEGSSKAAAFALLPVWARRAYCYLRLQPAESPQGELATPAAPPKKTSKKKKVQAAAPLSAAARAALERRVVRGMRRAAREGRGGREGGRANLGRRAAAHVARTIAQPADTVFDIWSGLHRYCMLKLRARTWRGDAGAPLSALEWAVIDLAVTHGSSVFNVLHYQHYRPLRALLATFHLVQRFGLEPAPGEPPPSPAQWTRAADWYSRDPQGAVLPGVVLQRRWHELRADTRRRLRAAWTRRQQPEHRDQVLPLHEAIARRYPHVVTAAFPSWAEMLLDDQLAPPTKERGPLPGAAAQPASAADTVSTLDLEMTDDGVIVIDDGNSKPLNADKTNARETGQTNDQQITKASAEKPAQPEEFIVADFVITDSDDSDDLKLKVNVEPDTPDTKNGDVIANFEITDSDEELQIDESDANESFAHALRKLDPRNVQTTIVFASDEEEEAADTDKAQRDTNTENVEPKENKEKDANDNSKNKSRCKSGQDSNVANESQSKKSVARRSDSSDSDDGVLVIDDCRDLESDVIAVDKSAPSAKTGVKGDFKRKEDEIVLSIEEEMFKETSNDSSNKDEVERPVDDGLSDENFNNKPNDPHHNPILSELLNSIPDDGEVIRRFQAIDRKDKAVRSVAASVAKRAGAVATACKMDGHAENASHENNGFEGGIDPKLLMYPVVLLTRLEDVLKPPPESKPKVTKTLSPKLLANQRHIEALSALPSAFYRIRANMERLKLCKPCVVVLEREGERSGRERRSRRAKRVELPDIEEVRRHNRNMLTAQVAPLAQQKSAGAKGSKGGEGGAPSLEELTRMLDELAGADEACKNRNPDERSGDTCSCGYGRCLSAVLAAPPASPRAAQLQCRLLRRVASVAKQRQRSDLERKERKRARKKKPEPAKQPVRRSPSPYDAERATREWLREKNFAAEKFGVQPRRFPKKPPPRAPLAPPPPLAPLAPAPAPAPPAACERAVLTLNAPGPAPAPPALPPPPEPGPALQARDLPVFKITPDLFNVDAVADINRKLGHLATDDGAAPAPEGEPFAPVITSVLSLATRDWAAAPRPDGPAAANGADAKSPTRILTMTRNRPPQTVPTIVLNRSQLKTLTAEPADPLGWRAPAQDAPPASDTIRLRTALTSPERRASHERAGPGSAGSSPGGQPAPRGGPSLPAPGLPIVVGPPSSISQSSFELLSNRLGLAANPQGALPVNSVQAGPSQALPPGAAPQGPRLQLVLTPQQLGALTSLQPGAPPPQRLAAARAQQAPAAQVDRETSVMRVYSVRSGPAKAAEPAVQTTPMNQQVNASQDRPGAALRAHSVRAGSAPQRDETTKSPQIGAILTSEQISSLNLFPEAPSFPQANPRLGFPQIVVTTRASAEKRKISPPEDDDDEVFNESDWPGLAVPAMSARSWAGAAARGEGGGGAGLCVLAAARRAWHVQRHLVLREPRELPPPPYQVYALSPLRRLLLPDDNEEESSPPSPKQARAAGSAPPRPGAWLKVKAFAKMTDDAVAAEESQPSSAGPGVGRVMVPAAVCLGGAVYLRVSAAPPVYAKVLSPVAGLRAAGAALLRRDKLYLYAPHSGSLAPLSGELDAQGECIVLTGAADMAPALGALARLLNPAAPAPLPPRGPERALVQAVRVQSEPDTHTYHLILNDTGGGASLRGGVVDLSSDDELSV